MILLDPRAGSGPLIRHPPLDRLAQHATLDSADAALVGRGPKRDIAVGVEIKSVSDLLGSVASGRLQGTQLPRMRDEYDVVWLLVHGRWRVGGEGELEVAKGTRWFSYPPHRKPYPFSFLEAWLLTAAESGVRVRTVDGGREAAAWLGVLSGWWSKDWVKHRGLCAFDQSREVVGVAGMANGELLRARVANCLPGVGFQRAVAAARHFPSVRSMVDASVDEWSEVEGIGKGIGKAIEEAVR